MGRGRGTWEARTLGRGDVGLGDAGTRGRGTRGRGDVGLGDAGRRTRGRGDMGLGDAGTSGHMDVINKQHLNYALNLQFTIFSGQEKGDD